MSERTKLWDSICTTDPKAVKEITGKAYKGHSPKPYWIVRKATETFGPVGIGWGVIVKSERFERMTDTDVVHVAVVSVWYMHDGKRTETFDQMGGTKAVYKTAKGAMVIDEDAGKKSVTDAMVKCLSYIGFAGDIFSGRWDDSAYVREADEEYRERERQAVEAPNAAAIEQYILGAEKELAALATTDAVKAWWKKQLAPDGPINFLGIKKDDTNYVRVKDAMVRRGEALTAKGAERAAA